MTTSTNDRAEWLMGRCRTDVVPLDQPCELGYHCPVCEYPHLVNGNFDERLYWSEYEGFLWCRVCNQDYPSAICLPHRPAWEPTYFECSAQHATDIFLDCVEAAVERVRQGPEPNDIA